MPTSELPILPYAGTSGWSGSATSRERVEREDEDGTTARRQQIVLGLVASAGYEGITAAEACDRLGLPTNSVAPSLTNLSKDGTICRITGRDWRRGRHEPYVMPEHVRGRPVAEVGRHRVVRPDDVAIWGPNGDRVGSVVEYRIEDGSVILSLQIAEFALVTGRIPL